MLTKRLRELYKEKNISDKIWFDSVSDLKWKLWECKAVKGIWGSAVGVWYYRFFDMTRFALGRLQYEKRAFSQPVYKDILKTGDTVLNCHIPSSGPLTADSVTDSLKSAYAFFREVRVGDLMPVVCHSWRLYPPHRALLGNNARAFHDLFDVIDEKPSEGNGDFWRIFNVPFSQEALSTAREDTSLRRRFKSFLAKGNTMGNGYGVLLFDGERVVKP
jgi:hypothetical protein